MAFRLRILQNIIKDGEEFMVVTTNSSKLHTLMNSIADNYVGAWEFLFNGETVPDYIKDNDLGALYAIKKSSSDGQVLEDTPQILTTTEHNGKNYTVVALPSLPYERPSGWIGWAAAESFEGIKKEITPFRNNHVDWKYFLVPQEDCHQTTTLFDKDSKKTLFDKDSNKEKLDMKKESKKYVGNKIKTTKPVFDWAKDKTVKALLRNKNDEDKLFALIEDEDGKTGHYVSDNYPSDTWEFYPKNLKVEKLKLLEIPVDQIEELEEKKKGNKMMDIDTEKVKRSGKQMATSFQHGMKVGAATEGVEFAYAQICAALHHQFGVSQETLNNPVNREFIQLASIAMLHLGSTVFDDAIPGMEHVQKGCELALEGKGKDNAQALIRTFAPLLMQAAEKMDPKNAMQRIATQVSDHVPARAPHVEEDAEEVEEEVAVAAGAAKAR